MSRVVYLGGLPRKQFANKSRENAAQIKPGWRRGEGETKNKPSPRLLSVGTTAISLKGKELPRVQTWECSNT